MNDDLIDIFLGLRRVPTPEEAPISILAHWRIFRAAGASHHFVELGQNRLMRMSSNIVSFDATALTGVTQSGRFYRLEGQAGEGEDALRAEDAFTLWLRGVQHSGCDRCVLFRST